MERSLHRGDIVFINLGLGDGSVQGGIRPAILFSNELALRFSPVVNIIPLTTKKKKAMVTHTLITSKHLEKESVAMSEQIQLISKDKIISVVGNVGEEYIKKINVATMTALGIIDPITNMMAV